MDFKSIDISDLWKYVVEATGDVAWIWNPSTGELNLSETAPNIIGCAKENTPRSLNDWLEIIYPEDRDRVIQGVTAVIEGRTDRYDTEHRFVAGDGSIKWALNRGKVIEWDSNGKPTRVIGIGMDITRLKNAENQASLQAMVLDQIADSVTITDVKGNIIYVNRAMAQILKQNNIDFKGKTVEYFGNDPSMGATQDEILRKTLANGEWFGEVVNIDSSGGNRLMEYRTKAIKDSRGNIIALCGVASDITNRRETEELLRKSEEKYRLLFNTLLDGFAYHEIIRDSNQKPVDYRFIDVNPAFSRLTGLEASQVIGKTISEIIPDIEKEWIETYGRIVDTGVPEVFERCIKGLNRWYRVAAYQPEKDKFVCVFQDITDRKRTQDELRMREEEYRRIVETASEGIWVLNEHLISTYANEQASRIFGYPVNELIGRSIWDFIFPEDIPGFKKHISERKTGKSGVYEHRFIRKNGTECWCLVSAVPMIDQGQFKGSFAMFTDITDRKNMETHLRHSQKIEAVGRLAAGVAHDFNNQLTIIQGYCDRLINGMSKDNPMFDSLDQIRKASQRSQSTTRHLLAYSRKQILQPETFDICEFLREIRSPISNLLGEDIRLELSAPDQPQWATLDRSELHHAIMNLVVNSRDAMPDGGNLNITVCREVVNNNNLSMYPEGWPGSFTKLCVIDTGLGMDQKTLDNAFDPFFSTKEVGKGTGLGLPMVQGFVSQSHGFMNIHSKPGMGTSVCLYFPEVDSPAVKDHAAPHATIATSLSARGALLVVEDEDSVRKLIVTTLVEAGHFVLSASTPSEALDIAKSRPEEIDLLISDIIMPEMKGTELSLILKKMRPGLRVLFITGYSPDQEQTEDEILQKPFRSNELIAAVRRRLG